MYSNYIVLLMLRICIGKVIMKIDHLAIWVRDLEKSKNFYTKYFDLICGEKYFNAKKNFSSYFLSFKGQVTRIELMHCPDIFEANKITTTGLAHFSVSVGSKEKVDKLTKRLRYDGYSIVGEPRITGDGYYESVVEDCDGNRIEIAI